MPKKRSTDASKRNRIAVSAFDVGEDNTAVCALAAVMKPSGGIRIDPLELDVYPLSKEASERSDELVRKFREEQQFLGDMDLIDVEQQAPIVIPAWKRKGMDPAQLQAMDQSYAGNIKAYGIASNAIGALKMAYPQIEVRSVSPQKKFGILGIHKPKTKARRKTRMRAFMHSWLMVHAHKKRWQPFIRKFCDKKKGDDLSDAFGKALAALLEKLSKSIDIRKVRKLRRNK